jgi:hypothetical protein
VTGSKQSFVLYSGYKSQFSVSAFLSEALCDVCCVFTTGSVAIADSYFAIIAITDADGPVPVISPPVSGFWRD